MPQEIWHEQTATLHVGRGEIAPVSRPVWEYRVNGAPAVVEKWFRYRRKNPAGRRSSDLDDIHAEHWSATMTGQLLDLLNVLGRCLTLEPRQAALLEEICAGRLISRRDLVNNAVLPVPARATKPPPLQPPPGTTLF